MDPPLEYLKRLEDAGKDTNIKWKLLKQLPGRRPAGQRWVDHLAGILLNEVGFTRSSRSPQFYWSRSRQVAMEVHMDDFHGCCLDESLESFRMELAEKIRFRGEETSVGLAYEHLKRVRVREEGYTTISPNVTYLDYVVKLLGLEGAKPVKTPGVASHRTAMSCSTPLTAEESAKYRSSVGEDVQYEISGLGTFIKDPTEAGMCALKRVVRYLLGTKNAAIRFEIRGRSDRAVIAGWADSDWAGDVSTRRSESSGHIEIDGCPVSGFSRRQAVIATSSGVAEFYALCAVAEEVMHLQDLLRFFDVECSYTLYSDSVAARGIARREGVGKLKGLEVRMLWLQQELKRLKAVRTERNKADLGTKTLDVGRLMYLRQACGIWIPGEAVMVKEDDFVVNKVQIGKTVSSSPLEVSSWDTIASHLHVVQNTLTLLLKALRRI